MNQILFWTLVVFGCVMACLAIPGLKIFAEAFIKLFLDLLTSIIKHKGTFLVWGIKTIISDHVRVLQHAFTSRDTLDPTQAIRRKEQGYDD